MAIFFYRPIKIDITFYDGYILSYDNENIEDSSKIQIIGELSRNLFSERTFKGEVILDDIIMSVQSPKSDISVGRFFKKKKGLNNGIKQLYLSEIKYKGSSAETIAVINITEDFKSLYGYSKELRKAYGDNSIFFTAPANNGKEARDIIIKMTGRNEID